MKIPNKIKIIGFDWEVKHDKNVAMEGSIFGSTHTQSQTIFLDPANTKQKDEHTFLHEIMHAVFWQTGLGRRFHDHKQEEEIVAALASGMYQVLKDNDLLK